MKTKFFLFTMTIIISISFLLTKQSLALGVEIYKDVLISTCAKNSVGCAPSAVLGDDNSVLLDQFYSQEFLNKHDHLKSKEAKSIMIKEIMGVIVTEKGHFPNPMADFRVLKPIRIIED